MFRFDSFSVDFWGIPETEVDFRGFLQRFIEISFARLAKFKWEFGPFDSFDSAIHLNSIQSLQLYFGNIGWKCSSIA